MKKYLNKLELELIEQLKSLHDELIPELAELQLQKFILADYETELKKQVDIVQDKKEQLINQLVATYGEGQVNIDEGTIDIKE